MRYDFTIYTDYDGKTKAQSSVRRTVRTTKTPGTVTAPTKRVL